jgi:hypothetical protein
MRHPQFRERIAEEPQEMLEKERCYVTRTAWRAAVYENLYWASVDEKGQCALGAAKRKLVHLDDDASASRVNAEENDRSVHT